MESLNRPGGDSTPPPALVGNIVTSGVDWFTCTAEHGTSAVALEALAYGLRAAALARGDKVSGAKGGRYAGFSAPGFSWGERHEDVSLTLSGEEAARYWRRAFGFARTVSRLDVQLTVRLDYPDCAIGAQAYESSQTNYQGRGRPASATLISSTGGGATCYSGAPTSDTRVRLYDKGVESGTAPPGSLWRGEAQYRRKAALHLASRLAGVKSVEREASGVVNHELVRRGLASVAGCHKVSDTSDSARRGSAVSSLEWLSKQVAPTVERLVAANRRADVLRALGLEGLDT